MLEPVENEKLRARRCSRLGKCRQLDQVVLGDRLQWLTGFSPGREAADNYKRVEAFFLQQMRHPGACPFARSSAVDVNVLVFGEILDLLFEIVGLDAN